MLSALDTRLVSKSSLLLAAIAGVACSVSVSCAQQINVSFTDWRLDQSAEWFNFMTILTLIHDPAGTYELGDYAIISPGTGNSGNPFHGAGVAFFTSGTNAVPSDLMQITTVYGIDLTPQEDSPMMNGVDLAQPEYRFASHETLIGISGTEYTSGPVESIPLGLIGSLLPDHDLSWFAQGDPNSMLYVFQTYGPKEEFYRVPAPAAVGLLGLSGLVAARRKR